MERVRWKVGDKIIGESPKDAAIREVYEESGVTVQKIDKVAELTFSNPNGSGDVIKCYVYIISEWEGEILESNEMYPQWFTVKNIPYDTMWSADQYWMPEILVGHKVTADFYYDEQNQFNHRVKLKQVDGFES
jgi:8-oxo-dGTP pyrophosphatase MutT (NUDIX family)